MILRSTV